MITLSRGTLGCTHCVTPGWTPGDGMLDRNPVYSSLTVANTPHNTKQDTACVDIRDVRLIPVIHGGISNWFDRSLTAAL